MGDRGNIVVVQAAGKIYLYTHWSGSELPLTLQDALLRGRDRWADESYLTRIVFCQMLGNDIQGTTGFGIGASETLPDSHHNIFVDVGKQTVAFADKKWSFAEYIQMSRDAISQIYGE